MAVNQSWPWVHFPWPDPTQPINWVTQPNPTQPIANLKIWTQLNQAQPDTTNSKHVGSLWSSIVTMAVCRNKAIWWSKPPIFLYPLYLYCTVPCNCMLCNYQKNIVLLSYSTQFNPTHRKLQNLDPTQPAGRPNSWTTLACFKDSAVAYLSCHHRRHHHYHLRINCATCMSLHSMHLLVLLPVSFSPLEHLLVLLQVSFNP